MPVLLSIVIDIANIANVVDVVDVFCTEDFVGNTDFTASNSYNLVHQRLQIIASYNSCAIYRSYAAKSILMHLSISAPCFMLYC